MINRGRLPIIGVTGNSGAGKGTVCAALARMGGYCIDADKLARRVMEPGLPAYNEIVNVFGAGVLLPGGGIDRKKLGGIVFRDPVKRKMLERIVHADVIRECRRLTLEAQDRAGYAFAVWDAPLLTESGMHRECDAVLLVTAPYPLKLSRILLRDGITEEQAILRLSSQTSEDGLYKTLTGDIGESRVMVIENNGSVQALEEKIRSALTYAVR